MEKPLISVVVAVYNVEKYVCRCLDYLTNQTYTNFEIILVDDESSDSSGEICDNYQLRFNKIKVIHQKNGGAAAARNAGVANSSGEYILFVDADDYVALDYIEFLYNTLKENKADIAICGFQKFFEGKENVEDKTEFAPIIMSDIEALEELFYRKSLTNSPCGKLIRRELFQQMNFPEGKLFEDIAVVYKWFSSVDKIIYAPDVKYFYLQRAGSSMHTAYNPRKWHLIDVSKDILDFTKKNYPTIAKAATCRFFVSNLQILRQIPFTYENKEQISLLKKNIKESRKIVLRDPKVKPSTKILALCGYLDIHLLRFLGKSYDIVINGFKIKLKN